MYIVQCIGLVYKPVDYITGMYVACHYIGLVCSLVQYILHSYILRCTYYIHGVLQSSYDVALRCLCSPRTLLLPPFMDNKLKSPKRRKG